GIEAAARDAGLDLVINRVGSMISLFFTNKQRVKNYQDVLSCDRASFTRLFLKLIKKGILLPPSPFETIFVSASHEEHIIELAVETFGEALKTLGEANE
ncbi:MAG: aspartate aminotransferase family protein, partial [Nitrososphaerota archaeon]